MAGERTFDSQSQAYQQRQHAMDARGRAFEGAGQSLQNFATHLDSRLRYRDQLSMQQQELAMRQAQSEVQIQAQELRNQEIQNRLAVYSQLNLAQMAKVQKDTAVEQLRGLKIQNDELEARSAGESMPGSWTTQGMAALSDADMIETLLRLGHYPGYGGKMEMRPGCWVHSARKSWKRSSPTK
jgi:hypothetical protein